MADNGVSLLYLKVQTMNRQEHRHGFGIRGTPATLA